MVLKSFWCESCNDQKPRRFGQNHASGASDDSTGIEQPSFKLQTRRRERHNRRPS